MVFPARTCGDASFVIATLQIGGKERTCTRFDGGSVRRLPLIPVPSGLERVRVPVDPALTILARFGELGKEE